MSWPEVPVDEPPVSNKADPLESAADAPERISMLPLPEDREEPEETITVPEGRPEEPDIT